MHLVQHNIKTEKTEINTKNGDCGHVELHYPR